VNRYLAGQSLYGEELSSGETAEWFASEQTGYESLVKQHKEYVYSYYALNAKVFSQLPALRRFRSVLGIGSAFGHELTPLQSRMDRVTVLEPAASFRQHVLGSIPVQYVPPSPDGAFPFPDRSFDLIVCFGVLHHIPKVSAAVQEMRRCVETGGFIVIREPIVSMGDWTRPRTGLTKNERGIPLQIFRRFIRDAGLRVISERPCCFSLSARWQYVTRKPVYTMHWVVGLDDMICRLPFWSKVYHPTNLLQRLRPTSVQYVLTRTD
jgi:SAM-dependent methyltransferase